MMGESVLGQELPGQPTDQRTISTVRMHERCTRTSFLPPFLDTVDVILQMLSEGWRDGNALAWVQVIANPLGFLGPVKNARVDLFQGTTFIGSQRTNDVGGVIFTFQPRGEGTSTFRAVAVVRFADGDLECTTSVRVRVNPGEPPEVLRMTITSRTFDPLNLFNFERYLDEMDAELQRQAPDARVVREESSYDGQNLVVTIESPAVLIVILAIFVVAAILVFLVWILVDRVDAIIEEREEIILPIVGTPLLLGGAALVGAIAFLVTALTKRRLGT